MLTNFMLVCLASFVVGYLLSLILFRVKHKPFKGSTIQTKIHVWIPIFLVVLVVFTANNVVRLALLAGTVCMLIRDFWKAPRRATYRSWSLVFLVLIIVGTIAFWRIAQINKDLFIAVWYLSVLSDVSAYFMGNFLGRHRLPKVLNANKSWEGVLGQLLGAGLGYVIFVMFVQSTNGYLWLVVGLGAALGDLLNSYTKRVNGLTDWSNSLPGHGGFIDRMSSLSMAALAVMLLTKH